MIMSCIILITTKVGNVNDTSVYEAECSVQVLKQKLMSSSSDASISFSCANGDYIEVNSALRSNSIIRVTTKDRYDLERQEYLNEKRRLTMVSERANFKAW